MKNIIQFDKAVLRKKIKRKLGNKGWGLDYYEDENTDLCIYIYDFENEEVRMWQVIEGILKEHEAAARESPVDHNSIVYGLGEMISKGIQKISKQKAQQMAMLAVAYMLETGTYKQLKELKPNLDGVSFIILRYYDFSTKGWVLRPATLTTDNVLTPDELEEFIMQVLDYDIQRHPERFEM